MTEFEHYLRTGRRFLHATIEAKFNPWHDADDGRFTFAEQGRYFDGSGAASEASRVNMSPRPTRRRSGGGSFGGGGASGNIATSGRFDAAHPNNHDVYSIRPGDSLSSIATRRIGLRVGDLAALNALDPRAPLRIGQLIMLPKQSYLDAGRDARENFLNLSAYMDGHRGRLPPNPARAPARPGAPAIRTIYARGYRYDIDGLNRTRIASGTLRLADGGRSKPVQLAAGGPYRKPKDHGGHYIARRFDGPSEAFNHFAQNGNFNGGAYRKIENRWAAALKAGKEVRVQIEPRYRAESQRPSIIMVRYWIDGKRHSKRFSNKPGG